MVFSPFNLYFSSVGGNKLPKMGFLFRKAHVEETDIYYQPITQSQLQVKGFIKTFLRNEKFKWKNMISLSIIKFNTTNFICDTHSATFGRFENTRHGSLYTTKKQWEANVTHQLPILLIITIKPYFRVKIHMLDLQKSLLFCP